MIDEVMHTRRIAYALCAVLAHSLVVGCATTDDRNTNLRTVDTAAFAAGDVSAPQVSSPDADASNIRVSFSQPQDAEQPAGVQPPSVDHMPVDPQPAATASVPPDNAESSAASQPNSNGDAAAPQPAARIRPGEQLAKPNDVVVIDTVIGQVSGRPIFADALLEPIADLLRREAERREAREFQTVAQQIIMERLREVVLTELFIAEAEASLTPDQQMGLMALLRDVQEKTIASGQGSRTVTQERLLEELGLTIEQYTERERHTLLIGHLINQKISPRVIVSWKDVQREYERRKDEFNPPATITYTRISLFKDDDAERVQQVTDLLAAGEPFQKIIDAVGETNVATEGPFTLGPDGVSDQDVSEAIRPHLVGLELGQTSQPIELGRRVMWWHVAKKEQPPPKSLYEVQRGLTDTIRQRRENEERERYIRTMFAKGMHDELGEMLRRAMTVALLRYGK